MLSYSGLGLLSSYEDQALKIILPASILSYSGLGLLSFLYQRTKYQISHTVIQHVQRTSLCNGARTQFAVPPTRIDPACPSGSECHLPRFLLTAVLSQEMNVSARVTLDTEFFCRCYAVQPRDFSLCRIRVTLDTVYYCWCYASICWNACKVARFSCRQYFWKYRRTASVVERVQSLF